MPPNIPHILAQATRTERVENHLELARWSADNALIVGAVVSAVCLYLVVWMYRREARGRVTGRFRFALISVRMTVLVLLGLIGLEPVLVTYFHRRLDAVTLVLSDASASMTLADRYRRSGDADRIRPLGMGDPSAGVSRASIVDKMLLEKPSQLLHDLADHNAVSRFDFARRPVQQESLARSEQGADPTVVTSQAAEGATLNPADADATDLAAAVRGALDSLAGSPPAAIVLLSDGNFNQGESIETIARLLRMRSIPLHAIGIGDPAPPVNVAVREIAAPRHAFKNDPFNVTVRIEAEGIDGNPITLQLWEQPAGGASPRLAGSQTLRPRPDGSLESASFEQKATSPGEISYVARVDPMEFETIATDNARALTPPVRILDDKVRVLVIAGAPTYDYRYLARMLERDPGIEVSLWLQSADAKAIREGNIIIKELPATQEELFKYDALILMDPDPSEFDPTWASLVASFINDHGGGVLYQAGNKFTGRFLRSNRTTSLVELLPVVPDPDAEIQLNDLGQVQIRAWPIAIPEQSLFDPIIRLGVGPIENRAAWSQLDGVYWHFPVRREKPVASVLMRHSDPRMVGSFGQQVLFATQFVGVGRSAWLGFNSTWRWRRADERPFNRFWIQTIRYLVEGRLAGGRSRGQIITERDEYEVGQAVSLTIRALDARFEPLIVPELDLTVHPPGDGEAAAESLQNSNSTPRETAQTIRAAPIVGREGYYQVRFSADRVGVYRVDLPLPDSDAMSRSTIIHREIPVTRPDIELRSAALNKPALQQLAAATGGRYLEVNEAGQLAELIPDAGRTQVTRERPRPLWDNATVFGLLLALLTIEWILRRQARLL